MEPDLFENLPPSTIESIKGKGGYAFQPGSGPQGTMCKNCIYFERWEYHDKTYFKCKLTAHTHGAGSDIRAKSPSCKLFGVYL